MNMPFPESMREAEAMDYAFTMVGDTPSYSVQYMVRNGWGRFSVIWEIAPVWKHISDTGKAEFMKHYWKHRLGAASCYKNEQ